MSRQSWGVPGSEPGSKASGSGCQFGATVSSGDGRARFRFVGRTVVVGRAIVRGFAPRRHRQPVQRSGIAAGPRGARCRHLDNEHMAAGIRVAAFVVKLAEEQAFLAHRLRKCTASASRAVYVWKLNSAPRHHFVSPMASRPAPLPGRRAFRRPRRRGTTASASSVSAMAR